MHTTQSISLQRGRETQSQIGILDVLTLFCIFCSLGFPGNFEVMLGSTICSLIIYGATILQIVVMLARSADRVMDVNLIDLKKKYALVYIMLLIMFAVSMLVTDSKSKQLTLIFRFSVTALFGLWLADRYSPEKLVRLLYLGFAGIALLNLLTYFVFRNVGFYVDEEYGYTFRGLYAQKNGAGGIFARGITFQVLLFCMRKRNKSSVDLLFIVTFVVQMFLLLVSKATTALFTAIITSGLVLMCYWQKGRGVRVQWGVVYVAASVGFLVFGLTILPLFGPFLNSIGKDVTLSNRTPMWEKIIEFMQTKNTMTGYGLLHFWETPKALKGLHSLYPRNSWYRTMAYGAHNQLLEMWLDVGLIGIAAYCVTIIYGFVRVKQMSKEQYSLCTAMIVPLLIGGMFDRIYTNVNYATLSFFIMLGAAYNSMMPEADGIQPAKRMHPRPQSGDRE